MNVHPLLVHFPIAFLTTYAIFELLRFKTLTKQQYWFYVKAILVFLGLLGGFAAALAGKLIEAEFASKLVSLHEKINLTALAIFTIIAFVYALAWLKIANQTAFIPRDLWKLCWKIKEIVLDTPLVIVLAIVGLLLITLGGALGGIIVYGPNLDPFTSFIYSLIKPLVQ